MTHAGSKRIPLVERHRPKTLDDVVGQQSAVAVLKGFVRTQCFPNLLLSGTSGVGKTSAAFAFINDFYASFGIDDWTSLVLSLNASQENGIETIRDKITPFASTDTSRNACKDAADNMSVDGDNSAQNEQVVPKIIVLDEADAITQIAQWALGPIIDSTCQNARYIFIVNYQRKIQDDLQSRCKVLRFPPLSCVAVTGLIREICTNEKLALSDSASEAIGFVSRNDMRMALNILSACAAHQKNHSAAGQQTTLDTDFVYASAGRVEPTKTVQLAETIFGAGNALYTVSEAIEKHLQQNNLSLQQFICDLHELAMRLAAPHQELDRERQAVSNSLKTLFQDQRFASEIFDILSTTEVNLLSITDTGRVLLQQRALSSALWLAYKHSTAA